MMFRIILAALTTIVSQLLACELSSRLTQDGKMVLTCEETWSYRFLKILKLKILETTRHRSSSFLVDFTNNDITTDKYWRNFHVNETFTSEDKRNAVVRLVFNYDKDYKYYNFTCVVYGSQSNSAISPVSCSHYHNPSDYTTTTTTSTTTTTPTTSTTTATTTTEQRPLESRRSALGNEDKEKEGDRETLTSNMTFIISVTVSFAGLLVTVIIAVLVVRCGLRRQAVDRDNMLGLIYAQIRQAGNRTSRFFSPQRGGHDSFYAPGTDASGTYAEPASSITNNVSRQAVEQPLLRNQHRPHHHNDATGNRALHGSSKNAFGDGGDANALQNDEGDAEMPDYPAPPPIPCTRNRPTPREELPLPPLSMIMPQLSSDTGSSSFHLASSTGTPHSQSSRGPTHPSTSAGRPRSRTLPPPAVRGSPVSTSFRPQPQDPLSLRAHGRGPLLRFPAEESV